MAVSKNELNEKIKIKSKIKASSLSILLIGGIGALVLGIVLAQKGIEKNSLLFIGIPFIALGIYSLYWLVNFDIIEITRTEFIIKSVFGNIKKIIPLKSIKSFNEIKKQNSQIKGEPAYMEWKDLMLFGNDFKYKISSTTYRNYPELKRIVTKGLKRNTGSEREWNRKNGKYFGIGFLIFGITIFFWLVITSKEINDKIVGGIFGLLFMIYGIYLIIKNK
ncbi:hypothetical protein SAMN05444411_1322 [Lutibacter oricola]|uniref:Uncharacterized protein n=1 Tax=Lutibacter oricola TaxID=762486 RepID=A0A1H3HB10_9FLAO|nr:hypothetical protein [Lutibacter oricola]SDY12662.1 hypothetical protein SAMN05444411_1322 [Lutibacter oricola]